MKKIVLLSFALCICASSAQAGVLRDLLMSGRSGGKSGAMSGAMKPSELSKTSTTVHYGNDQAQAFDIYVPPNANNAPIIMMVHGGGWKNGDKAVDRVVDNKVNFWGPKGFIFVSVNYRMLPDADPFVQAQDVARAIAKLQQIAPQYHGDPNKLIAMGHSAGAHLVALISANPELAAGMGAKRWVASVILDSGALDVPAIMNRRHAGMYDEVFGKDPSFWAKVSPLHNITRNAIPMQIVCSTLRGDDSCGQSKIFAERVKSVAGQNDPVLPVDLKHGYVNTKLGEEQPYSDNVDGYIEQALGRR